MADNTESRQNHDIYFRMTKEPEQVQEQNRVASALWNEEGCAEFSVVSNIAIAPARTGTTNSNKKAVINIAHANNGVYATSCPECVHVENGGDEIRRTKIDDTPARCKDKMAKSMDIATGVPAVLDIGRIKCPASMTPPSAMPKEATE